MRRGDGPLRLRSRAFMGNSCFLKRITLFGHMIFVMVFHFFMNQNHWFDELNFIHQNDVFGGAKCRRTIGNSIFYSKKRNFKTHRVIANDDFLTKKDRLGSHRTIGNYRFLTKKGTPSGANCELNPHAG